MVVNLSTWPYTQDAKESEWSQQEAGDLSTLAFCLPSQEIWLWGGGKLQIPSLQANIYSLFVYERF